MLSLVRQRGFNLIEAVITLAVLALLIAAGLPSVAEWIRATHMRNLAETTQNGLQRARMEAMKRNQVVTFWLVSPNNTAAPDDSCKVASDSAAWVVSLDNPEDKCATAPSPTEAPRIVQTYGPGQGANGITVAGLAADGATAATSISFNGYGQPLRTGTPLANINIDHTDATARKLRVEISASGSIRMCDRSLDPAADPKDPRACNNPL